MVGTDAMNAAEVERLREHNAPRPRYAVTQQIGFWTVVDVCREYRVVAMRDDRNEAQHVCDDFNRLGQS